MKKTLIILLFVSLLVFLGLGSVQAAEKISHPFDDSALLMISSQMRLNGEVESANTVNGHLLSVASTQLAQQNDNEIDILIQMYKDQITALSQSDEFTPELEGKLLNELEDKVDKLEVSSEDLVEVRQPRRRGGLIGFFNRVGKGLGRGVGWLVGRTMEGAGKVVDFGVREVAPEVLKKAMWGDPVSGAIQSVLKEKIFKRLEGVIFRQQEKRAKRAQVVLEEEAEDYGDNLDLELDLENEGDVLVYEFTKAESANYEDSTVYFQWGGMGDAFCREARSGADNYIVHLEFDLEAMTVSGWMTGDGQYIMPSLGIEGFANEWDVQGNFRTTFSDFPLLAGTGAYAWNFAGVGLSTVSFGGTVLCSFIDPEKQSAGWQHYYIEDQISLTDHPTQIYGAVFIPTDGRGLRFETFTDPVDEFTNAIRLTVNQTIDLPAP